MAYHLTDSGDPKRCTAKQSRCPYGGSSDHYATVEEAREAYEAKQTMDGLLGAALSRNPKHAAMQELIEGHGAIRRRLALAYVDAPPVAQEFEGIGEETIRELNADFGAHRALLSEEERSALDSYTGIAFDPINGFLRDPEAYLESLEPEARRGRRWWVESHLPHIDSALSKGQGRRRRLFRRLDQSTLGPMTSSEEWAESLGFTPGATVNFAAYSSTTVDPGYVARTVGRDQHTSLVLVLDTEEGAPVGYTVPRGQARFTQEAEAEVLLPRGRSFVVDRVERAGFASEGYDRVEVLTVFLTATPDTAPVQ